MRPVSIILVAGAVKPRDKPGHHDYLGGCRLLAALLSRIEGVQPVLVSDGWPLDESVLEDAAALVFYEKGGGKQGFLAAPERVAAVERAARNGAGLVVIHQAVGFPAQHVEIGKQLLGGVYASGVSRRGHWKSTHAGFPAHPITRCVQPWSIRDGWLNRVVFVDEMRGVTPLLWSGKRFAGSPDGGDGDIVAWAYDRPDNGRSFVFTGLDSHHAWSHAGLRRLVVGGILWAAGVEVPPCGAPVELDQDAIRGYMTPRQSRLAALPRKLLRRLTHPPRW